MNEQVVQVKILGGPKQTYAYRWTGGTPLKVYDWVTLPGSAVNPDGAEGMVASIGAEGYTGPLKDVTGRGVSPLRWIAWINKVSTREQASTVWKHAEAAGVSPGALGVIASEGWARLARVAEKARQA
jgi:hypothetical protein